MHVKTRLGDYITMNKLVKSPKPEKKHRNIF